LEWQQLKDVLLARDGQQLKAVRKSLRLEHEAEEAGEQDVVNVVEQDVKQAAVEQLAPSADDVLIDLEGNAVEQIDEAAAGAAADAESAVQAEETAVDEAIEEAIDAADIAAL